LRKANLIFVAAILALSVYAGVTAMSLRFVSTPGANGEDPRFYPLLLVIIMVIVSVILLTVTLTSSTISAESVNFNWLTIKNPLILMVSVGVFGVLLKYTGFLPAAYLLLFTALKTMKTKTKTAIITTLGVGTVIFVLFTYVLKVPLPTGTLWEGF
jgi:hypothetical protein